MWSEIAELIKRPGGVPVPITLHPDKDFLYDPADIEAAVTPKTKAIYINSPQNPTGGVLTRGDIEAIAAMVQRHNLWLISDEAYEDVVFDDVEHVSPASLHGMYERTISAFTFSKTYAATGLRLGYVVTQDPQIRDRMKKALFYTASNVTSVVQFGAIGALEGPQDCVRHFRDELRARRDFFYEGIRGAAGGTLSGEPPRGAFYAFLRIADGWRPPSGNGPESVSWAMAEYLITNGRIGCVPGVDFGANGEHHIRFCFARERNELKGALQSMSALFAGNL